MFWSLLTTSVTRCISSGTLYLGFGEEYNDGGCHGVVEMAVVFMVERGRGGGSEDGGDDCGGCGRDRMGGGGSQW